MDYYALLRRARDDGNENVDELDPLTAYRVARLIDRVWDEHGERSVTIESAVRTYSEQKHLYDGWKAGKPGFNLAANPDRVIGYHDGVPYRGSWHMGQPARGGFGFAVDFTRPGGRISWFEVHKHLGQLGLGLTVPGEPWHVQAFVSGRYLPGPDLPTPVVFPDLPTLDFEEDPLKLITDTETNRQAAVWVKGGTTYVRWYGRSRAGAGVPMPGISHVIDEQAAKGNVVVVS